MSFKSSYILYIKKHYPKITIDEYYSIIGIYSNLKYAIDDKFNKLTESKTKIKLKEVLNKQNYKDFEIDLKNWENKGIKYITFLDKKYPKPLLEANPQPLVIFYQGNIDLICNNGKSIAIIGARKMTTYSKRVLDDIAGKISELTIVSGLAYGVDSYAQNIAIENDLPTIGVIGGGLLDENFYPKSNINFKNKIIEKGGLVISQFFPDSKSMPYQFPIRNQLIVLLSNLVWVVQASLKSGSNITANLAYDFGVDIATTPANIYDENYMGNIKYIKNGCHIISQIEDINSIFDLNYKYNKQEILLTGDQLIISEKIKTIPKTIDEIESELDNELANDIMITLSQMEIEGIVDCVDGDKYILIV